MTQRPVVTTELIIVRMSKGLMVATSITSADIPFSASASAASSVSAIHAPQLINVTSVPWRKVKHVSNGKDSPLLMMVCLLPR